MDLAATYRGTEMGRKRQGPDFTVVLVGEVFNVPCHPLFPVTPTESFPFALLPICNTPIIDYILENLAENGVDEVNILLNSGSVNPVRSHLQNNNNARQKPWLESKDMRVKIVESARKMASLFDAVGVILEHNVVKQNTSFLFVPIDTIAFFTNLRDLFNVHVQRTKNIRGYKATLLCTSVRSTLENTLRDVLVRDIKEQRGRSGSVSSERDKPSFLRVIAPLEDIWPHTASRCPPNHLTMFSLEKSTGVVRNMMRLEPQEEITDTMAMEFNKGGHISVRTDLVPTDFFFCSDGALSNFLFHMLDQHAFLGGLLDRYEVWGGVFGVEVITPSGGIVQPINSLKAYIQANIDVCCRRFFPLTCESGFAEDLAEYAVSPHCQSVYIHRKKAKVLSNACEPCVVVGEEVVVPPKTVVRGTVLGRGVEIGEGSVIIGCVLLDGVKIGRKCVLHHSLIGYGVIVGDKAEVSNSIIDSGCVIGTSFTGNVCTTSGVIDGNNNNSKSKNNNSNSDTGDDNCETVEGVVVLDQAVVKCKESETEESLRGCYRVLQERYLSNIVPTREIFVRDPVPRLGDDSTDEEDEDEELMDMLTFKEEVVALVDQALRHPSRIVDYVFQMKNLRLTFGRKNCDLCRIVTEHLLIHVLEKHEDQNDPLVVLKAAEDLFKQWCHPFFVEMVAGDVEMQAVLEVICATIGDTDCLLHVNGEKLMECLYIGCDVDLYEKRGYCIVSGESLVEFGDRMRELEQQRHYSLDNNSSDDDDDDDRFFNNVVDTDDDDSDDDNDSDDDDDAREEGMLRVALSCLPYIDGIRALLDE